MCCALSSKNPRPAVQTGNADKRVSIATEATGPRLFLLSEELSKHRLHGRRKRELAKSPVVRISLINLSANSPSPLPECRLIVVRLKPQWLRFKAKQECLLQTWKPRSYSTFEQYLRFFEHGYSLGKNIL